ncbi:hypothetical protein FHX44_111344 [Pseudonocardia hierapolitana]|uniref:Amidohydrolase family protein n=1 Tax=Pseudonocardia hierapolitana TaxID=1128676 RepID=A0A561SKR7_9PSEU|nr:hypothetical protein [Pseudonocardia hierapolitana]TWF75460.1 hypothetical protein FHX44_111344 [Pseudonocardia hierapolitana]
MAIRHGGWSAERPRDRGTAAEGGAIRRIAPGFDADLVAVRGDPLADLAVLHRPLAVFARGGRVR